MTTLDDRLNEIEHKNAHNARPLTPDFARCSCTACEARWMVITLLAALREAIRQRDSWVNDSSGKREEWIGRENASLLALLNGGGVSLEKEKQA